MQVTSYFDLLSIDLQKKIIAMNTYKTNWKTRFSNDVLPLIDQGWRLVPLLENGLTCPGCYIDDVNRNEYDPRWWCEECNHLTCKWELCQFSDYVNNMPLYLREGMEIESSLARMCKNLDEFKTLQSTRATYHIVSFRYKYEVLFARCRKYWSTEWKKMRVCKGDFETYLNKYHYDD